MRRWRRIGRIASCCVLAVVTPFPIYGQETSSVTLRGLVSDTSSRPVHGAQVSRTRSASAVTDEMGRFELQLRGDPPHIISVRRIGYKPMELSLVVQRDTTVMVTLVPIASHLAPVHASADRTVQSLELRGFYQRLRDRTRGANTGHFLTPEDVERRNTSRVTILVDGIPGVKIFPYKPATQEAYLSLFGNTRCPMTVYLDGARLNALRRPIPVDVDAIINGRDIAAVEVYSRSNAPNEYRSLNGTCGVVLLWSK